jgi:hypothetical protein
MARIPYPNVPQYPGVPQIPRIPSVPTVRKTSLGLVQGNLWKATQSRVQWGILDSKGKFLADPSKMSGFLGAFVSSAASSLGIPGLSATLSTKSVDYSKEFKISDFPVEKGGFASYNKVELPATPIVTLCFSGTERERATFLSAIDKAAKSLELYTIATPERNYPDHLIERYTYQRTSQNGATLLTVELTLREVREVELTFTQAETKTPAPKSESAAPNTNTGKVQAVTKDTSFLKDKFGGFFGG